MPHYHPLLIGGALCLFAPAVLAQDSPDVSDPPAHERVVPTRTPVAIFEFAGADREMGRFLADTLRTDLSRSVSLAPGEEGEVTQALADLELAPGATLTPLQVRQIGRRVHADRLVVGSFLNQNNRVTINARLLETQTGLVVPGGAMNVEGDRQSLLTLTHRLARLFHKRITGEPLDLPDPSAEPSAPYSGDDSALRPLQPALPEDSLEALRSTGLIPASARANGVLQEADLASVVRRVASRVATQTVNAVTPTQAVGPVSRLRALTALVKLLVSPVDLAAYRTASPREMPPDMAAVPLWGAPFLAAAVDQSWWSADKPMRPRENATWAFVAALLEKMPISKGDAPAAATGPVVDRFPADSQNAGAYTGIVVDAREFMLSRDMNLRILDDTGKVVYPDPRHIPDADYLQDNGMAAFITASDDTARVGAHPLRVRALDVAGPGHDDVVVSQETADRIRSANRQNHFLWRWKVAVLTAPRSRGTADTPDLADTPKEPR